MINSQITAGMGKHHFLSLLPSLKEIPHLSLTVSDGRVFMAEPMKHIAPWGHTWEGIKMNSSSHLVVYRMKICFPVAEP